VCGTLCSGKHWKRRFQFGCGFSFYSNSVASGFRVQGSGFRVYGLGFSLYSNLVASGLRVEGLAFSFRV